MTPSVFVRYCVAGHEIRFSGLCPSNCPVCGGPVDRSRRPVSLQELEAQKADQPKPEEQQTIPSVAAEKTERQDVPGEPAAVIQSPAAAVPVRQPGRSRIPLRPAVSPADGTGQETFRPNGRATMSGRDVPERETKNTPAEMTVQLDFFGEKVSLPSEGGWLGRQGIGAAWFEGNRYISRRHVFVKPDLNGRLVVQQDSSLNGVYYDQGNGRQRLDKESAVILKPGDLLWLYNIPLKVESGMQ